MISHHRRAAASRRLLALIALLPATLPGQTTFTWTGALDNAWDTDGNWDQTGLPTATDYIVVNDGGYVTLAGFDAAIDSATVGYTTGGSLVIGADGSLTITNALDIGCGCASGFVTVESGGTGSSGSLTVNAGSRFTVTGEDSAWTVSGLALVQDSGAEVLVESMGHWGTAAFSVDLGGSITVTGSGTTWSASSSGGLGNGSITIDDQAAATLGDLNVATSGGDTATFTVKGGATLGTGNLSIGLNGDGTLDINTGGVVTTSGASEIGSLVGSVGSVTVDGEDSRWDSGNLTVGLSGHGHLDIRNGGVVNSGSATIASLTIGAAGDIAGTVLVTGTGSQWNLTGNLGIGAYFDEDYYNSGALVVSDGALVEVGTGGTGIVTIDTNGSVIIGSDLRAAPEDVGPAGTLSAAGVVLTSSFGIGGPSATPASLIFNHSDDIAFNVPISGDGLVTKTGGGNLTLGGSNTYTGTTTVDGGVLSLGHANALGASALVINDGEARVTASGNFTLANSISGAGDFTHAGSGELTLASANTYGGATSVTGGGKLILAADGATGDSEEFNVNGASTLRIESGVTLPIETLIVEDDSVIEVAGTLSQVSGAYGADITDSTLHVLSGGFVEGSVDYSSFGYYFFGDATLQLDTADAIGDSGYFSFQDDATLVSSTPGAIAAGAFRFVGTDPLSADPARTLILPGPGVITGGSFELEGKITTTLSQTGMLTGAVDLDLYDNAELIITAPGAIDGTAVTLGGDEGVILGLDDDAVVRIETDNALVQTSLALSWDSRFILNGHDVTIENLGADGGMIVNNSPTPATLTVNPCGCGPTIVFANLFADSTPDYVGTAGALSLDIDGNGDVVFLGIQRHTGPTTVSGVTFAVYGDEDDDLEIRGLASSPLTLRDGGTLAGNGPVNTVTVQDGGGFSPGHIMMGSVNQLETGSVTLSGDTFLSIDLLDATGLAASGWDLLIVDGTFTFSGTLGDTFTVFLRSGDEGVTELLAGNFDPGASYSFTILQATGGIIGFDTGLAFVNTSGFANSFSGTWSLRTSGDNQYLFLDYVAPIPEPASFAALGAAAALSAVAVRRRRRAA